MRLTSKAFWALLGMVGTGMSAIFYLGREVVTCADLPDCRNDIKMQINKATQDTKERLKDKIKVKVAEVKAEVGDIKGELGVVKGMLRGEVGVVKGELTTMKSELQHLDDTIQELVKIIRPS